MNNYWVITNEETKDTKWALGSIMELNKMIGYNYPFPMTEELLPASFGAVPKLFDSKEDVLEWMNEIKETILKFFSIKDDIQHHEEIKKMGKEFREKYKSIDSIMFFILLQKHVYFFKDKNDGLKIIYERYHGYREEIILCPVIVKENKGGDK